MRWLLSLCLCCCCAFASAIPAPRVFTVELASLPTSLSGMRTSTVQCASVESFQEIRVTVAKSHHQEKGLITKILVYAFAGQQFRVQQVDVKLTKSGGRAEVREWIRAGNLGWLEVDPFEDTEVQSVFWEEYAHERFGTTAKDLTDVSRCSLK